MTDNKFKEAYDETLEDMSGCCCECDCTLEDIDGICPDCGRATSGGDVICKCSYSPIECKTCGARPCDGSC